MTVNINQQSLAAALSNAQPAQLADMLRSIGFGSFVRRASVTLRRQAAPVNTSNVISSYDLVVNGIIVLPDDAKAKSIQRAVGRANSGSVTNGELTVSVAYTTPATENVAVTPAGNLAFLGTDGWTDIDIDYTPADQDVIELDLPVVSGTGVCTIPAQYAGVAGSGQAATVVANQSNNIAGALGVNMLLEAEALAGTTTGKFIVLKPGSNPGTTKEANLDVTKSQVLFKASDAVTMCRVKLGIFRAVDLNALLEANTVFF